MIKTCGACCCLQMMMHMIARADAPEAYATFAPCHAPPLNQ